MTDYGRSCSARIPGSGNQVIGPLFTSDCNDQFEFHQGPPVVLPVVVCCWGFDGVYDAVIRTGRGWGRFKDVGFGRAVQTVPKIRWLVEIEFLANN